MALHEAASERNIRLSGSDWFIHEGSEADFAGVMGQADGWSPATVPGNIQADLEKNRHLTPLWYGTGDPRLMEQSLKDWWYRKDFAAPKEWAGQRLTLVFDGVDYACEIWVNGTKAGAHEGMFQQFAVDVTGLVRAGTTNRLGVRIAGMPKELLPWLVGSDGAQSGVGTDYFFVTANDRIRQTLKGLKSPANCSYDWGTNIYTLGIWKDVRLEATGPTRIEWVQVKTRLDKGYGSAAVEVTLELDSTAEVPVVATFSLSGHGAAGATSSQARLPRGKSILRGTIVLDAPRLWWPEGQGEQPLYRVETAVADSNGRPLDRAETRFGVRDVRWEQVEGAPDGFVNPFRLVLNGRTIRTVGSNMTAIDLLFGRAHDRCRHFVELAKACNMNTLRLHGGQIVYPQSLYDAADELGIMLLSEFPMGNCAPENEPVFLKNLDETVGNIVKQLRNHPSIIEWSGGNEMSWYFDAKADRTALEVIRAATAREDDTRRFIDTCPVDGSRHSPWDYNPDLTYAQFNADILDNKGTAPMMRYGEFGCQTASNLEVWHREIPVKSQWPIRRDDPVLIRKNAVEAVFGRAYWLCTDTIERLFGKLDDLEMTIRTGQFMGAEGLRYMMDALRAKGRRLGGFTSWDYNEPWPNGAGSYLVDHDGRPVMMYYFAKQAMAPVSLQLRHDGIEYAFYGDTWADLQLVSDAAEKRSNLRWKWTARARNGEVYGSGSGTAEIAPLEVVRLDRIRINPPQLLISGPVVVELVLSDSSGQVIAERPYVFGARGTRAPLRGLLKPDMPDRPFGIPYVTTAIEGGRVSRTSLALVGTREVKEEGCECIELALRNDGPMTALFVEVAPMLEYRTDLFIDNQFAFIPPRESRSIAVRSRTRGGRPLPGTGWTVSCWNADTLRVPPSGRVLLHMGRRDSMCREFAGYLDPSARYAEGEVHADGAAVDCTKVRYALQKEIGFVFSSSAASGAHLDIHTSDRDASGKGAIWADLNGNAVHGELTAGHGLQLAAPDHLASPASFSFDFPHGAVRAGQNRLRIGVKGGWLTWDALEVKVP